MLKNIPPILSPELLKVLAEMGHSDRICIGDGNFPGAAMAKAKNAIFLRADGHGVPELLDAILQVMPLDTYVEKPAILMEKMECDKDLTIPVWDEYKAIIAKHDERGADAVSNIDRFDFYDEAKDCYCILQSGETAIYANIILQKGVIKYACNIKQAVSVPPAFIITSRSTECPQSTADATDKTNSSAIYAVSPAVHYKNMSAKMTAVTKHPLL